MVYVTGDTHGDRSRFTSRAVRKLRGGDTLIICGDFGFLWGGGSREQKLLEWLGKRRYNILFVEGTHDNLDLLYGYPIEEWQGGRVRRISGRLRQLVRGEQFELEGITILALGGGQPDDGAQYGVNCWRGVLPDKDEVIAICDHLDTLDWAADLVVSHQPPTNIDGCITHAGGRELTTLTALMNTVQRKTKFLMWCFGSYHINRFVPPNYRCLYNDLHCAGGWNNSLWGKLRRKRQGKKTASSESTEPIAPESEI